MFLSDLKDLVVKPKPPPPQIPSPARLPGYYEVDTPVKGTILGCGIVQLGQVWESSVAAITEQLQQARWKYEAALVVASTGKSHFASPIEENLIAAGFKLLAEAPNMRHEYANEEPNRHHVKLWVCDVTNIAKPEVVPPPPKNYGGYADGMRV